MARTASAFSCLAARSGLTILVASACTAAVGGTIEGSSHDFSAKSWVPPGQTCVVCHSPTVSDAPLSGPQWSRPSVNAIYRVYASPTLHASVGQPGETSRLCLSCHDGTLALQSVGVGTDPGADAAMRSPSGSLAREHPIGFTFNSNLARRDAGLWDPAVREVTIGSGSHQRTGTLGSLMLVGGRMECSSCHDVHNRYTVAAHLPGRGNALLRISTTGSSLCLACHRR